ncbi:hypothetical protein [Pigmentiphaga litoralis]|uniref:hypothetical protein n=1 Tax=Pigmentiphaga litoralis TaxID=516702 RepID=UPI003B43B6F7
MIVPAMPMLSAVPQAPDHAAVCAERGRWALAGLPSIAPGLLVPEGRRAVVVTPDPDDEVASLGGLIHGLHFLGRPLTIIAATGEAGAHQAITHRNTMARRRFNTRLILGRCIVLG